MPIDNDDDDDDVNFIRRQLIFFWERFIELNTKRNFPSAQISCLD